MVDAVMQGMASVFNLVRQMDPYGAQARREVPTYGSPSGYDLHRSPEQKRPSRARMMAMRSAEVAEQRTLVASASPSPAESSNA